MYIHIYIYIYMYMCMYIYIYIYIYKGPTDIACCAVGNFTSLDFDTCLRSFARIRRLRESPQYALVILRWKITVSANLRKTSTRTARKNVEVLARRTPYCAGALGLAGVLPLLDPSLELTWEGRDIRSVLIISIRKISNCGSQIPEPSLMFNSTCPLKVQISQGLGPFFLIEL